MGLSSRYQLLLLLGLVTFLGVELYPISLGRGANYATETELALEPVTVLLGDPVVMTVRVWSPQTMLIPRGGVTFEEATNGAFQVVRALNTTGYANYTWLVPTTYPPGNITIHARYGGNDWFDPSEAFEPLIIDDGLFTTTTDLVLSATSLFPGETVDMAAAVQSSETPSTPQGEVLFEDATNGAFHETVPLDAVGNASCSWTVPTAYPSGTITLRASYTGSAEFAVSEAVESLYIASPFSTVMELTLAPNPVGIGDSVHMAALIWSPETTWIPTGTVQFYLLNESLLLEEIVLNGTGHATTDWVVPVSWVGYMGSTVTIYAKYGGDTYFAISNATSPLTIDETTYPTETALTLSPNAATPGSSISLEAHVTAPQTALIPTGSVSFVDATNAKALGTGALDATGRAHLLWTIPSTQLPGDLDIRAHFLGGAAGLFSPSEATKPLLVAPYSSTTTVTLSPTEMWGGGAVEIQVEVTGVGTSRTPTGTITLRDKTHDNVIDTLTLDFGGKARKTWTVPRSYPIGTLELATAYAGNPWFYPSRGSTYLTFHEEDTTPPRITLSVAEQEVVSGTIAIEITAEDERGVTLFVNEERLAGNPAIYPLDTAAYDDGEVVLVVRAVDAGGNEAVLQRTLIIDNAPPDVTLEYKQASKNLTVTVRDQHLNATAVYVNGSVHNGWMHPQDGSVTMERFEVSFTDLPPGTYSIQVDSIDRAGNLGFRVLTIVIEDEVAKEPSESSAPSSPSEVQPSEDQQPSIPEEEDPQEPTKPMKNTLYPPVVGLGVVGLAVMAITKVAEQRGVSARRLVRRLLNVRRRGEHTATRQLGESDFSPSQIEDA